MEIEFELLLDNIYIVTLFLSEVFKALNSFLPSFLLTRCVFIRLKDHIIEERCADERGARSAAVYIERRRATAAAAAVPTLSSVTSFVFNVM